MGKEWEERELLEGGGEWRKKRREDFCRFVQFWEKGGEGFTKFEYS